MKSSLLLTLVTIALILPAEVNAQDLLVGYDMFSRKKTAYVTLSDGSTMEGTITKVKRKKGLFEFIAIEDASGKKHELDPADIDHMYLPPSGLNKFATAMDEATTMSKWDREEVSSDKIKDGYAYFEQATVEVKGETKKMLMQLLNPGFSSKLRVYFDPAAAETARAGVGGITVAGGLDKSYYVQRPDETAYRLKKKEYKQDFETFYSDCPGILATFGEKPDWDEFAKHIYHYSTECN